MTGKAVVIVGSGQAGYETAVSLRDSGFTGEITIIGDEGHPPYRRPPLSKEFLGGAVSIDQIALVTVEELLKAGIRLQAACRAVEADRDRRRVRSADGRSFTYDFLVLATGTKSRKLRSIDPPHGLYLRDIGDANVLKERLQLIKSVVVVGAGFMGLEIATVASSLGLKVDVIEVGAGPLGRSVSSITAHAFTAYHEAREVVFHFGSEVSRVSENDSGQKEVELRGGTTLAADLVVVSAGAEPNVELAMRSGLANSNGILVDEHLRTIDPAIFAVGDCATFPCAHADGALIRLESVQNAVDQARHVARAITEGIDVPYFALPWFWSDQAGRRLQIAGIVQGHDDFELVGDPAGSGFSVLCFKNRRLIGVESVNQPRQHMAARRLLQKGEPVLRDQAKAHFESGH